MCNGQIEQVPLIDFGLAQRSIGSQETQTGGVAAEEVDLISAFHVVSSSEVPLRTLLVEALRRASELDRVEREQVLLDPLTAFPVQEIQEPELRQRYVARLQLHDGMAPLF